MAANEGAMKVAGTIRQSESGIRRTAGRFRVLIEDNRPVFRRYFGVELFAGSLNIDVPAPATLQEDLDRGKYRPAFVIPKTELVNMPTYIGDGQAWQATLAPSNSSKRIPCWVFRRIGSKVPKGVIEVLADERLASKYGFIHGDTVELTLFEG